MSSTTTNIIACISSALQDSQLFWNRGKYFSGEDFSNLYFSLRLLKTFVLCGKMLHNDESFKIFLVSIEEKLRIEAAKLHGSCASDAPRVARSFGEFIDSLAEEMDKWYVTMLDISFTPHSTFFTITEILEIITLNLETIIVNLAEQLRPLKTQVKFVKNLIHFVTKGSTEARKDLLSHAETIAINMAYILFRIVFIPTYDILSIKNSWEESQYAAVSTWVQKMKLDDTQVYEIYTQSLSASKLSEQSLDDDDDLLAVKNFLDSLMSTLVEMICIDTRHMGLMKDQLQELYERLSSLRINFKQPSVDNMHMEISDVVADVGIFICSIYLGKIEVHFEHQHLLEKFEIVLSKVAEPAPEKLVLPSPRTSSYGFVDCILENLRELVNSEAESTVKSHFETIRVELASMEKDLRMQDERVEFQTLSDRLLEMAFRVENVIDQQAIDPLSTSFTTSLDSIIRDIGDIKVDVSKIEAKEVPRVTFIHRPSLTTSTLNEVVGFQDEQRAVLDRLRWGSHHLRLIAIVGMPGLGKTTLAKKVYDHSSLSYHFSVKAWCPISQTLDKKKVLFDLLKQTCPEKPNMSSEMSEYDLAAKLRRSLKRKRYLIFLDDIWNTEAWNNLKDSFPNDSEAKGSRIIFTSRSIDVAPREMLDQEPLILSPLNETDSLKLMCSKLFRGREYTLPPELRGLAKKIVAKCGGLPLAIIVLARVLANAEVDAWLKILGSFNFLSSEENCRDTLEFSYRHLPYNLKPCFLYFGTFPEDAEVSVWRILRLWIAEGFVRKSEESSVEVVAEGYLNTLIGRSLIIGTKRRYDGGAKTCHIHDLLRDFCLQKAKDEYFFHSANSSDELNSVKEPHNVRRLLTDFEALNESRMYFPVARSLLLRRSGKRVKGMSYMFQFFKLLKVLDLEQAKVGYGFPSAIQHLVLLAFLAIKGYIISIPSWSANLSNLEILILIFEDNNKMLLSGNLLNIKKLKYLYMHNLDFTGGGVILPIDNLDDSSVLYELESFRGGVIDWCSMEKQLRKCPNIRKLKCSLSIDVNGREYVDKFVFPEFLYKLESLDLSRRRSMNFGVRFEFASLRNLKKLRLSGLCLYGEIFSIIGNQLPSLEVLKLQNLKFIGEGEYVWEMKMGELSNLRVLHMSLMPIRRWIACDDHEFDCFQKLVLVGCRDLVGLPSCLEMIETLEEIVIGGCSETIRDLVMNIEVAQNDWGNSGLKITRK